jgi:histidinol-phosphate aminotransferase
VRYDVEQTGRDAPALIYVASPNNPTGVDDAAREDVHRLLGSARSVVLDEAYAEFDGAGCRGGGAHPRLLVLRTMSKAVRHRRAARRLRGGSPELLGPDRAVLGRPYRVGRLSEALAVARADA